MGSAAISLDLFTLDQAAAELHVSERHLRSIIKIHGCHRRVGRRILFTRADLIALLERMKCPSACTSTPIVPRSGASVGQSSDTGLTNLLDLLERRKRKPSQTVSQPKSGSVVSMASRKSRKN